MIRRADDLLTEGGSMYRARLGDWILTFTGLAYWPCDPRADEVRLEDIAHALSQENRYGGHTYEPYSVAQHSCLVCDHLPWHLKAQGLLHDATEAYLKDIPRPIKKYLAGYKELEILNARAIGRAFGIELVDLPPEVDRADKEAVLPEKRDLMAPHPRRDGSESLHDVAPWPERIVPWTSRHAEQEFMHRAHMLGLYRTCATQ